MPYDIEDYREDQYKDFQASLNDEQEEEQTDEEAIEEFINFLYSHKPFKI